MRRRVSAALSRLIRRSPRAQQEPEEALAARAFDRPFYLRNNPDVAEANLDPLTHFMTFGWREGRDPNPEFSVRAYLDAYPELEGAGVNPLVHYLMTGQARTGRPESPLGFRTEVIERLAAIDARVRQSASVSVEVQPASDLAAALARSRGSLERLHITFSHDDYTAHLGGVQLCVGREAAKLAEQGRDHLHLYSAKAWPVVRAGDEIEALGVIWNGQAVGAFAAPAVIEALAAVRCADPTARSFAIHSLLGHEISEVLAILTAAGVNAGTFWLHDFASVCAGFHLLRNDVQDCGAPPPESAACGICVYGPWRARHVEAHARLFGALRLTVAAPSQVTLDLWKRAARLPTAGMVVLPHATLTSRGPAAAPNARRPFRLAYAGLPVTHKGWAVFRNLVSAFAGDARYDFVHLGARADLATPVRFRQVGVRRDEPSAMMQALQAADVDAVLIWPLCRETFSFVAYEAVAAGCAVVTGPDSGNVQAFVREGGHGSILPDEAALASAFRSGKILELGRARRRPMLYDLRYSALSLDLEGQPRS